MCVTPNSCFLSRTYPEVSSLRVAYPGSADVWRSEDVRMIVCGGGVALVAVIAVLLSAGRCQDLAKV